MLDFFDDIHGQERVKNILSNFNSTSKIPHALLFTGLDGVGKEAIAVRFAQLVNSVLLDFHEQLKSAEKKVSDAARQTLGSKADVDVLSRIEKATEDIRQSHIEKIFGN